MPLASGTEVEEHQTERRAHRPGLLERARERTALPTTLEALGVVEQHPKTFAHEAMVLHDQELHGHGE